MKVHKIKVVWCGTKSTFFTCNGTGTGFQNTLQPCICVIKKKGFCCFLGILFPNSDNPLEL